MEEIETFEELGEVMDSIAERLQAHEQTHRFFSSDSAAYIGDVMTTLAYDPGVVVISTGTSTGGFVPVEVSDAAYGLGGNGMNNNAVNELRKMVDDLRAEVADLQKKLEQK